MPQFRSTFSTKTHAPGAGATTDSRANRTVWVGGLPAPMATETAVRSVMRRGGDVLSVHVRVKEGVNKNWALVMFSEEQHAAAMCDEKKRVHNGLQCTAGWKIKPVLPEKLKSLEAQFVVNISEPRHWSAVAGLGLTVHGRCACRLLVLSWTAHELVEERASEPVRCKANVQQEIADTTSHHPTGPARVIHP